MGIRTDGLGALLDALVESVERGGRGEEIAARVHVSRFHFDRLVSAAIGETSGAFRRRLLLERAAWALGNGAPVGDAARVAGYESPEAFSRAFKRAFGRRAGPTADSCCRHPTASTSIRPARSSFRATRRGGRRWISPTACSNTISG